MIPLRVRAEINGADVPFVVRLLSSKDSMLANGPRNSARIRTATDSSAIYDTDYGELRVQGIDPEQVEGDVLLVVPRQQIAHRLIRAHSPHNTFLVTEQCDQLCVMCSQPPKVHHVDLFDHFETAAPGPKWRNNWH